jgi:hypothetical protein
LAWPTIRINLDGALCGFEDTAALDAIGAGFDLAVHAAHDGVNDLKIGFEQPRRDGGYVLADPAFFLGLAASQNAAATDATLTADFTTSRHGLLLTFLQGRRHARRGQHGLPSFP